MSKERRYQDDEIRQILDLAIDQEDGPVQSLPAVDGLTLLELQVVFESGLTERCTRFSSPLCRAMEHISRYAASLLAPPESTDD